MTVERDFIRAHTDKGAKVVVSMALAAGITGVTNRLVHKVRWQDKDAARRKTRNASYDAAAAKKPALTPRKRRKHHAPKPATVDNVVELSFEHADEIVQWMKERQFIRLADEIGYERACELLDLWRESMRRVVASI